MLLEMYLDNTSLSLFNIVLHNRGGGDGDEGMQF